MRFDGSLKVEEFRLKQLESQVGVLDGMLPSTFMPWAFESCFYSFTW